MADDFVGLGVVALELVGQSGVDAAQLAADARVERGESLLEVGGRLADGAHGNPFGVAGRAKLPLSLRRNGSAGASPSYTGGVCSLRCFARASVRCGRLIFLPVECVRW